jgi:type IV pilus assembly protein PilB
MLQITPSELEIEPERLSFAAGDQRALSIVDEPAAVDRDVSTPLLMNRILLDAVRQRASDIHFESFDDHLRIRLRVDGVMQEMQRIPRSQAPALMIRLKAIAGLDISEKRQVQGGRFRMLLNDSVGLDFRCSITPTLHGEAAVLRLLYLPPSLLDLGKLGLSEAQIDWITRAVAQPQGLILVTGPTGSGKTVTLYTLLRQLNTLERSIYTLEDPVEIDLPGVNQIRIAERQGISFEKLAINILRQDPDVIMLGEVRDQVTLNTAINAAHTGHLVLATLHASDAPGAIARLRNLGVDNHNMAATLRLVISQRLLRRLNPDSRVPIEPPREQIERLGFTVEDFHDVTLYRAGGTREAATGYLGRLGIFQLLPATQELKQLILDDAEEQILTTYAQRRQLTDLRWAALQQVRAGLTDLDEVERVLGPVDEDAPDAVLEHQPPDPASGDDAHA